MRVITKQNIDRIANAIKEAVKDLTTTDYTCSRILLDDDDLAIYVGWSDGYDPKDTDCYHAKDDPTWCLNAGIKIRNDFDWADYNFLMMPVFNNKYGDVCMTDCTISPDEDYRKLARYFLGEWKAIREGINRKKILIEF